MPARLQRPAKWWLKTYEGGASWACPGAPLQIEGDDEMIICRAESDNTLREIRILERILTSAKACREKKLLAIIGLINIASSRRIVG